MIKTLSKQVKGFVKESVLTPVFMILEVVFETLIPLLMASIIDDGINKGDMNHILFVGGGMVLCAIGGLICGILGKGISRFCTKSSPLNVCEYSDIFVFKH